MKKVMQFLAFILAGSIIPAQARVPFQTVGQTVNREADTFATKIAAINATLIKDSARKLEAAEKSLPKGKKGFQAPRTTPQELAQRRLHNLNDSTTSALYAKQVEANTKKIADKLSNNKSVFSNDLKKDIAVNLKLPVNCSGLAGSHNCPSSLQPLLYLAAINNNSSAIRKLLLQGADPALVSQGLDPKVYQRINREHAKIAFGSNELTLTTKGAIPQQGEDFISTIYVNATSTKDVYKISLIIQKDTGLDTAKINELLQINSSQKELAQTVESILSDYTATRKIPSATEVKIIIG